MSETSSTSSSAKSIETDSTTPEVHPIESFQEIDGEGVELEEEEIVLRSEDFISGPFLSDNSTVPYNILEMDYSYGYNCKKYFNLIAPDEDTVVYIGGNIIHFLDVKTGGLTFRRSYLGGGLGHITMNPNKDYPYLTIAENGENPPIMIYEWPSMEITGVLKEGAARRYSHINYSPDGELLVSQSFGPDFLITVWNWKKWRTSPIILRTKSHVHDVYRCMFSFFCPGQITTCGSGHIKFWKMAQTFTGLKLQGELGRFGKTEITDIVGIYQMPDEKVISGTEWGNLLVWEAGLIKLEVLQTNRRRCHNGPVLQLEYIRSKGEIWTISEDGWVRAWDYRVIDEADPPDEDRVVQMVPSYEWEIPGVAFRSMCKKKIYDQEDMFYFAQDSNGGIWQIDLALSSDFQKPRRVKLSHAGKIVDMATSPWGPYFVSLGIDGRVFVYQHEQRIQVGHHKFNAQGRALIWLPMNVDSTGSYFIAGFDDGVVRVFTINFQSKYIFKITQSIKPHTKAITAISLNKKGSLFVTGGEDACIFVFQLRKEGVSIDLGPIGFIHLAAIPSCFTWLPKEESVLLIGCNHGELFSVNLPQEPVSYTKISYLLHSLKPMKQRFTSCKAQIRRDLHIAEIEARKADKLERKKQEILTIKEQGIDIDEELYLEDSEEEEILEPLHIPEIPNPILFMMYTPEDTIWLSMGGYDAGYIYEYRMDQEQSEPLKTTIIADGDDTEMYGYIYSPHREYIITSMQNGNIRINRINQEDFRDLSNYWQLSMHDNFNGRISKMCFSYNNEYFFSAGEDGNLFSYRYKPEIIRKKMPLKTTTLPKVQEITSDESYDSLSLEEMMIKAEQDKQMQLANEHKRKLRQRLKELTAKLTSLLDRNCKLPRSQRHPLRSFIVDERIFKALDDQLEAKVALEERKLAFEVEKSTIGLKKMKKHYVEVLDMYPFGVKGINISDVVNVIVVRGLKGKFFHMMKEVDNRSQMARLRGRKPDRKAVIQETMMEFRQKVVELEPFLVGLSPSTIAFKLGNKLTRYLMKYRERKQRNEMRQEEWNQLYARKPLEGENHPDDVKAIKKAANTIGDFKLKSSPNYKVPAHKRDSTVSKYKELLLARLKACKQMISAFNHEVYEHRQKKERLIRSLHYLKRKLDDIHEELPKNRIMFSPPIPEMTDLDYPEKEMQIHLTVEPDFADYLKKEKTKPEKLRVSQICEWIDWEKEALNIELLPDTPGSSRDIIMFVANQSNLFCPFDKKIVKNNVKPTFLETEMEHLRLVKKIHDQANIIAKMNEMITNFDKDTTTLTRKRFDVQTSATFLEIHILSLNQELIIVKDFELVEDVFSDTALEKWTEMMDQRDNMKRIELKIEAYNFNIDTCQEQIKTLQQTFLTAAKDNKFWDFLRRIFKKKYRPPRIADDEDSSSFSSESSSESEEDETGSLDSRDIGPIRLDESVCPKGCDRELYDYTFTLRSRRHELERQIVEEKRQIDICRKELDQASKRVKLCDQANRKAQNDLEEYQKQKQRSLNNVPYLVLLKLSQMKHLNPDGYSVANLDDTLVFNTKRLKELYTRVTELQIETLNERTQHRKNRIHLRRMTADCQYMQKEIVKLKAEIHQKMILKFGSRVKIDEIEEAILRRMVLNLRISMLNLGKIYEKENERLRELYAEKQKELKNIIRENTARLDIFAVLNKEKTYLVKVLRQQEKLKAKASVGKPQDTYYIEDIDKLEAISKSQQEQIEMLKAEIKSLSTKSLPLKPIKIPETVEKEPELIIDDFGSLDELYEPPVISREVEPLITYLPSVDDQEQVSDEDIVVCVRELIKEIIESFIKTEETPEQIIIKIFTEILEQIPMSYLDRKSSLDYVADLMKDLFNLVMKEHSETVIQAVSQNTHKSEDEVSDYISQMFETEE